MAARFRIGAGTTDWSDTAGWSTTSGGGGGSAVPTSSDAVTFDANSTQDCVLNTATAKNAASIVCTNYTHTLTFNVTLTVAGSVTWGASMSFAGSSALLISGTCTFTSNGKTQSVPLTLGTNITITMGDNLALSGTLTISNSNVIINSNAINLTGNLTSGSGTSQVSGTTTINLIGTSQVSWGGAWTAGGLLLSLTINTAGTITWSGTVPYGGSRTLTYTAGTVSFSSGVLQLVSPTPTLTTSGMTWVTVRIEAGLTVTMGSDLNISGDLILRNTNGGLVLNSNNINVGGNLTQDQLTSGTVTGTTTVVLNGTGTWSQAAVTSGAFRPNLTINTSGTITFTGTLNYDTGTFTYTAGTVSANGSTFNIQLNTTVDFGGITLGILKCTVASVVVTLKSDVLLHDGFTITGTNANPVQVKSNVGATLRKITCLSGLSEDVVYCNPTDIDSRDGVPVYYAKGTLSNTFNWTATTPGTAKKNQIIIGGTTFNATGYGQQVFGA